MLFRGAIGGGKQRRIFFSSTGLKKARQQPLKRLKFLELRLQKERERNTNKIKLTLK